MKKFTLIIGLLILSTIAGAQSNFPFPESGAHWNVINSYQGQCDPPDYCKYTYFMEGDTLLEGVAYHKVFANNEGIVNYYGGLRVDGQQVYYYDQYCDHEIMLYDFSLETGDSIFVPCEFCDMSSGLYMYIESVDSVLLSDGFYHKRINFDYGPGYSWIEGIGSEGGLLRNYYSCLTCTCFTELVCYSHNDTTLYTNEDKVDCFDFLVSTPEIEMPQNIISVYPNPAGSNSSIIFISGSKLMNKVVLYDLAGKELKSIQDIGNTSVTIGLEGLHAGMYLYRIELENDNLVSGKLLVE